MNFLMAIFLGTSLITSAFLTAEEPRCACENCTCTPESHCGCLNTQACSCGKGCKCGRASVETEADLSA